MNAYLSILKARFLVLFQYRGAAFAGFFTQLFWGIIKVMILQAFFEQSTSPEPMTLAQAMTFVWIGQSLLALLPWNIDKDIEAQIKQGDIAYELIRPLDLYWAWYSKAFAMRVVPTFLRSIPLFIVAGLFFQLTAPVSLPAFLGFLSSVFIAAFVSSAITSLVITSLFWTISGEGIVRLMPHTAVLLSGMIVPLPLFPDWMQPFLNIQPLRCIMDIPCRIYTGLIPAHEIPLYLAFQLFWFIAIVSFGRFLMRHALKRIVIQGG